MHVKTSCSAVELNSKVAIERAKVVGLEVLLEMILQFGDELRVAAGEENVVHVD